ncbi:MAG: LacI family transcriptional regulator [Anaerolineae bacterium]|nr:LacI family transcriptional regulator [Anaerolineae bacterium]
MKRPTQVDVARLAGVSRATVSYVLNDPTDQRIPISAETRQRVLSAIAELGYEIDARAQALRSGDTRTIGVLLPIYENPFFWQMLRGISSEAEAAGYSLLLAHSSLTPEQENQSVRELAEQRVDGLVMLIGFKLLPEQITNQLRRSSHPIVEISGTASEFDYVHQDYGAGTRALMNHLIEFGHRRVGFIYGVTIESQGFDRLDAYRRALEAAGLPYDESLVYQCGQLLEDGYEAAVHLLNQPDRPTALLAINDLLGMAAIRAAADLGLHVPGDVSIASFDNIPFSRFIVPRLTSVSGEPEQNGRDAVQLLLRRLSDPDRPREVITSSWALHVRESTGPAPSYAR